MASLSSPSALAMRTASPVFFGALEEHAGLLGVLVGLLVAVGPALDGGLHDVAQGGLALALHVEDLGEMGDLGHGVGNHGDPQSVRERGCRREHGRPRRVSLERAASGVGSTRPSKRTRPAPQSWKTSPTSNTRPRPSGESTRSRVSQSAERRWKLRLDAPWRLIDATDPTAEAHEGRQFCCRGCRRLVVICRKCDRGNVYAVRSAASGPGCNGDGRRRGAPRQQRGVAQSTAKPGATWERPQRERQRRREA